MQKLNKGYLEWASKTLEPVFVSRSRFPIKPFCEKHPNRSQTYTD